MKLDLGNPDVQNDTNILEIEVPAELRKKIKSGIGYIDDALGGTTKRNAGSGITPSTVVFFTGGPGAGKTTLMMQLADSITDQGHIALFNTNEQNLYQVKMVAERLKLTSGFICNGESSLAVLFAQMDTLRAQNPGKQIFYIQDSLQTLGDPKYPNDPTYSNGKTAERALASVASYAKKHYVIPFMIGQVNKDGNFAGNNKLLHMVDTHMHLFVDADPDAHEDERLFEIRKNRFGCSGVAYNLMMGEKGLREKNG
jgi:DNA repair protein RadA/Sms